MSPFERRLRVLQFVIKSKGSVTATEILDNNTIEVNHASLNNLLKRLVRDGYLKSVGTSTHLRYYRPTDKATENIKA